MASVAPLPPADHQRGHVPAPQQALASRPGGGDEFKRGPIPGVAYASWAARLGAMAVDIAVLAIPTLLLWTIGILVAAGDLIGGVLSGRGDRDAVVAVCALPLLTVALHCAYWVIGWTSGKTLGMRVTRIEVVDQRHLGRISTRRALTRALPAVGWAVPAVVPAIQLAAGGGPGVVEMVLLLPLMGLIAIAGAISALVGLGSRGRGWPDRLGRSVVVHESPTPPRRRRY